MRDIDTYEKFIKEYLCIDEGSATGLTWTGHPNKSQATKLTGIAAGTDNGNGYYRTRVNGKILYNHRIVWFLQYGIWPEGDVDHIDGCRNNNHPGNLRVVTRSENMQNMIVRGYSWNAAREKWEAHIKLDYKKLSLGFFDNEDDARAAYLSAKSKLHPSSPERCYE